MLGLPGTEYLPNGMFDGLPLGRPFCISDAGFVSSYATRRNSAAISKADRAVRVAPSGKKSAGVWRALMGGRMGAPNRKG